jgi:hypothetical protein
MKGHKRYRSGAWRLVVAAGTDPVTGRRRSIYETVSAPNNRAGAKLADTRLAELVVAVESGHDAPSQGGRRGPLVNELAQAWQQSNRPRRDPRSGDWMGWSPKTAKTVRDNFRFHILPAIGRRHAADVTALELDRLYERLLDTGLSPTVVLRCHGQVRAMISWAVRKKLVTVNPALAADPPRVKPRALAVPTMAQVRAVQDEAAPAFAAFLQLAATLGARRGTLLALRWGDVDIKRATITFSRRSPSRPTAPWKRAPSPSAHIRSPLVLTPRGSWPIIADVRPNRRWPSEPRSVGPRLSSPTTAVPATGAWPGRHTDGSCTRSGPECGGFVCTIFATPRPARC